MELDIIYLNGICYKKNKFLLKSDSIFNDLQRHLPFEVNFNNLYIKIVIFKNFKNNNVYNRINFDLIKNHNIKNLIGSYKNLEIILLLF